MKVEILLSMASCLFLGASLAAEPTASRPPREPGHAIATDGESPLGDALGQAGGMTLRAARRERLPWVEGVLRARSGGGGDVVAPLKLIQTGFSDPLNGNVVLLIWDQTVPSPGGVQVLIDGSPVGTFQDPGGLAFITDLEPGDHSFRVQDAGVENPTWAENHLPILTSQPFGDPTALACGESVRETAGTCRVLLRWVNSSSPPSFYLILLDDETAAQTSDSTESSALMSGVTPGVHKLTLIGFLQVVPGNSLAMYRGAILTTTCSIACEPASCLPASDLQLCQSGFGIRGTKVRAGWTDGQEVYPGGVVILLDGKPLSILGNDPTTGKTPRLAFLDGIPLGEHTIGVQADCGSLIGRSAVIEKSIALRSDTPYADPILGDIVCDFNAQDHSTTATWTNAHPADLIDVYVLLPDFRLAWVETLPGSSTSTTVTGMTSTEESIVLQFFATFDGQCYGSKPVGCRFKVPDPDERRFVRGLCNGEDPSINITTVVFTLEFLFLGGATPPCLEACDSDGDTRFEITDPIYTLNFLFLGGPPPPGLEGVSCQRTVRAKCETSNAACP
jgi:hypothetical protein